MTACDDRPRVYGTPGQMALLFGSIGQLVGREPDSTFEDKAVRDAARGLIDLLERRLTETD